jgi:hypothetical protein
VALNDLALALEDVAADYRVIGGHMVTRAITPPTWEPVSGFEPLACRLQDGCSAC